MLNLIQTLIGYFVYTLLATVVNMRIGKTIKGELFNFYLQFIPNEKKAKVRYFQSDDWTICDLSDDYNYVLLPKGKFRFNDTDVEKLKLNKSQKLDAMDYNCC